MLQPYKVEPGSFPEVFVTYAGSLVPEQSIVRSCIDHLHNIDVSHRECCFAVAEVIVPLAGELRVKTKIENCVDVAVETLTPQVQRSCVVQSHVFEIMQ